VKADTALPGEPHLRAAGRHLPYGITQCYLPPDTSERSPPYPSHAGWYSIYLPRRDGRLSWPSWLGSEPATFRSPVQRWAVAPPRQPRQRHSWL